jgi:hypothetical protein
VLNNATRVDESARSGVAALDRLHASYIPLLASLVYVSSASLRDAGAKPNPVKNPIPVLAPSVRPDNMRVPQLQKEKPAILGTNESSPSRSRILQPGSMPNSSH